MTQAPKDTTMPKEIWLELYPDNHLVRRSDFMRFKGHLRTPEKYTHIQQLAEEIRGLTREDEPPEMWWAKDAKDEYNQALQDVLKLLEG